MKTIAWAGMLLLSLAFSAGAAADDATAYLRRAAAAMGADEIKSLRIVAKGTARIGGQARRAGELGARANILSQTRTVDYVNGAIGDEVVRTTGENPFGAGGGIPPFGEQRQMLFAAGGHAWNQVGPLSTAAPLSLADRMHQLWVTPHGVVKAAQRNGAKVDFVTRGGKSYAAVSFAEKGVMSATAFFNDEGLVERVESSVPHPVLGDQRVVTEYSGYRDFGGVRFPATIKQTQDGGGALELQVSEVKANAAAELKVPDAVRAGPAVRVAAEKAADGVWYLAGGSHHSVAIEMKDHIVLVEAPLYEGRSLPVLAETRKLIPGKPIRYVINTHYHFDHSGGLRAVAAEGVTVVTHASNKAFLERAFAVKSKLAPDALSKSGKKAKFMTVADKHSMSDGARTLEILHLKGNPHNDGMLMVWLPKERLLIEVDVFTPVAAGAAQPPKPNPVSVALLESIERMKLPVDRILPLHGRMVAFDDLKKAVGR